MPNHRHCIVSGSVLALISVVLGAFGAHALKDSLIANETTEAWKTAVNYQMWHAIALILCGILQNKSGSYLGCALFFGFGSLLFSGSLYWISLGGPIWLGPITPIGGLCLIAGWLLLIITQLKHSRNGGD